MTAHSRRPPTTKAAWKKFVFAEEPPKPESLTAREYRKLSAKARAEWDEQRYTHHQHLGPYAIGEVKVALDRIERLVAANDRLPDHTIRPAAALDGDPGLGKTTLAQLIGKRYHQRLVERHGELISDGDELAEYWPSVFVPLPHSGHTNERGGTSPLAFTQRIAKFLDVLYPRKETAPRLMERVADALARCGTTLVIVDDIHYVNQRHVSGKSFNNHLKNFMNETCATFLFVGVGLEQKGFFKEGAYDDDAQFAQIGTRVRRFPIGPVVRDDVGLKEWRALLAAVRRDLVLLEPPEPFDREMSEYLYGRTQGSIGALMELFRVALEEAVAREATKKDAVLFDRHLLDGIELSYTTERRATIDAGKPRRRSSRQLVA